MRYKDFETLRKNADFQKVYRQKKSAADAFLILYVRENKKNILRLGISVSKKVGNSVVRHRLSRIVREAFRLNTNSIKKGYDIVTVIREPLKGKNYDDAEKSLIHLLKKKNVFSEVKK